MTQQYVYYRYIYQPAEDGDKKWAIIDRKRDKTIGHIHNRVVAEQVVRELNTMETRAKTIREDLRRDQQREEAANA